MVKMHRYGLSIFYFFVVLLTLSLTGCGKNNNTNLYDVLPINTDGNPSGSIVLVEFLDYSDPASLKLAPIINEVMEQRQNVRVIYYPITLNAKKAYLTKMVLAASLQDRFLAAHHLMINSTGDLTKKQAIALLSQAFIDTNELTQQVNSAEVLSMLTNNDKLAAAWHVASVPTFFVGRINHKPEELIGPQSLSSLLSAIDKDS